MIKTGGIYTKNGFNSRIGTYTSIYIPIDEKTCFYTIIDESLEQEFSISVKQALTKEFVEEIILKLINNSVLGVLYLSIVRVKTTIIDGYLGQINQELLKKLRISKETH